MRRALIITVVLFAGFGCTTQSSLFPATPVNVYLNEMIDYMEENHVNRANINWTDFRNAVQQHGASAAKIADANATILYAFELLDDPTSFMVTARGELILYGTECTDVKPNVAMGTSEIGYIQVPSFNGTGVSAAVFAEQMHGAIRNQDSGNIKGWIIDLRQNTGGNMWPMLTGIGPLLGNGTAGYFVDGTGTKTSFGYSTAGSTLYNDEPVVTVTNPYASTFADAAKIAILTNKATTNAAEVVMIAFSGKALTRTFGAATCGRASGNQTFSLSDGSVLFLTTAFLSDRNEVSKKGPLVPDEVVADPALIFDQAVTWINN